ncbi:D-alanyl-D-alanine carboxypeptidase family protein [Microbispora triticiradicis]|uniref:Peptidase M15B domain-containing protein n=2 Tax=Microbispora TaxID=2005 RepID=A0ABY3LUJ2_9ACTN|nr:MULTISPECIES: D-alanyl-D-alanine carboxypeptidase family protein [Microbispora]TLP52408.1 hypothetical protein FED44_32390 [Microbispora fusca]TYB55426.1 hypothetical protein FXF59_21220 [Microbispora tritici]
MTGIFESGGRTASPGGEPATPPEPAGPSETRLIEHWAFQVDTPFRPVHEITGPAPGGPASSPVAEKETRWSAPPSAEQVAFREKVLRAHLERSGSGRAPLRDLSPGEQATVPGTDVTMRADAASAAGRLLTAANEALSRARDAGDPDALRTQRVTAVSGYRDSRHQAHLWRKYFGKYYNRTSRARAALAGGPHGDEAVRYMIDVFRIPRWIAAPGYSKHQSGTAIDLHQKRAAGSEIHNDSRAVHLQAWHRSWLYRWLHANAPSFGFAPYKKEPWHWEYAPGQAGRGEAFIPAHGGWQEPDASEETDTTLSGEFGEAPATTGEPGWPDELTGEEDPYPGDANCRMSAPGGAWTPEEDGGELEELFGEDAETGEEPYGAETGARAPECRCRHADHPGEPALEDTSTAPRRTEAAYASFPAWTENGDPATGEAPERLPAYGHWHEEDHPGTWREHESGLEEETAILDAGTLMERFRASVAVARGERDENALTNLVFAARHPELGGRGIRPEERQLAREWLQIRDAIVRPVLRLVLTEAAPSRPQAPVPDTVAPGALRSTSWLRRAWERYHCREQLMTPLRVLSHTTPVNPLAVDAFRALDRALRITGYQAKRAWVCKCRLSKDRNGNPTGWSLHSYGIAVDIDPECNPHRWDVTGPVRFSSKSTQAERCEDVRRRVAGTSFTQEQIAAVESIRTVDGLQVFAWGGRWRSSHDAMHFQINVSPVELARGIAADRIRDDRIPQGIPEAAGQFPVALGAVSPGLGTELTEEFDAPQTEAECDC